MPHSSDSDEFFDAEEITPSKINTKLTNQNQQETNQANDHHLDKAKTSEFLVPKPVKKTTQDTFSEEVKDAVDLTPEKNVGQGRRRFRELRQYMQTEDDDCGPSVNSTPDSQNSSAEGVFPATSKTAHPFKIIEHDTMSLQSLTSLGRIGRILGGTIDPSGLSLGRDSHLGAGLTTSITSGSKELLENPGDEEDLPETNIVMQEPDVIASTKANSLKYSRVAGSEQSIVSMSQFGNPTRLAEPQLPVAPPRKKKKIRVAATMSLGSPDDDHMLSEACGGSKIIVAEKLQLSNLNVKPPSLSEILNPMGPLPSPASTIESLTREFQNSLDMGNSDLADKKVINSSKDSFMSGSFGARNNSFGSDHRASPVDKLSNKSEASSRSSTLKSVHSHLSATSSMKGPSLDIRSAVKGQYVVKPQDEERAKAAGPSQEELQRIEKLKNELLKSGVDGHSGLGFFTSNMGHSSLGASHSRNPDRLARDRRKSAGDEDLLKQLNMYVRTRTDSGKQLTDMEILEQVTVLNLDTGERVPLSIAEDKLPQCINPLSLHIMRLTSEYVSNSSLFDDDKQRESDDDTMSVGGSCGISVGEGAGGVGRGAAASEGADHPPGGLRRKTAKLKRFLGSTVKKTMDKAKSIAQEVSHARHREDVADIVDEVRGEQNIKLKASNSHKGPYDFDGCIRHVQEFSGEHVGPVWCMKFSQCGRLLATAGQDKVLRIWVVREAYSFFQDMRTKYNADQKASPTPSQESLVSHHSVHSAEDPNNPMNQTDAPNTPFMPRPFCTYTGHTSDLLDVSWSKNYFVLSSSMDKTVRLWHISRKECLCCFQHIDFVTAIVFHPRDDRYFLSGSLDGKIRLWNIPDKKVAVWNDVSLQTGASKSKLITAANFCQNGKFAVVGSYDGRCIFYTTDQLKYHTQIDVRSTRGKNSTGRKISGIEPMPGEDKILVTSNDSRIRLYDLRDLSLSCKYKGYVNVSSQIKASFSHDGKYIVSGSENQCIYIWKTHHDYSKFSSVRRDRNDFWEGIKAHNAVVTCAVFAPNPDNIIRMIEEREQAAKGTKTATDPDKVEDPVVEQHTKGCGGHVLVSADFNGCIKVFVNKTKPKHSSLPASALV